jgi:hypothetical protein
MVIGGGSDRKCGGLWPLRELSQCKPCFKSAKVAKNQDGLSRSEIRFTVSTLTKSKLFLMQLTRRAMRGKPVTRPRSGLENGRTYCESSNAFSTTYSRSLVGSNSWVAVGAD